MDTSFFEKLLGIYLVLAIVWLLVVVITLVVIFKRKDLYLPEKLIWTAIILFAPVLGLIIYFIWGPSRKKAAQKIKRNDPVIKN